ncbi:DUF2523 family protein [Undibacterium sp. TJN25]|uniref:DUF2523 family protein n=1 Tax=Undibacterium sp. TJN25 TaxID=3413056 RepID=UPI003BF3724D
MPFFVAALMGALGTVAASLVGRVLLALGMGFVTYTGFKASTDALVSLMKSSLLGMPVEIAQLLGYVWVDKALSLIVSSFAAALVVKLAGSDTITKLAIKK